MSSPGEYALFAVLLTLSTTACALRVVARIRTRSAIRADDYWAFAALGAQVVHTGVSFKSLGLVNIEGNFEDVPPQTLTSFLKLLDVAAIMCTVIVTFAKFSIIYLYKRIFGSILKRHLVAVGAAQFCWMIITAFVAIFRCRPTAAAWDVMLQPTAKCFNLAVIVYVSEPINALIDLWLAALPIPAIMRLQMSTKKKICVSGIFAVGIFVAMTSVVRVVETSKANVDASGKWAAIQQSIAIVCCCLPVLTGLRPRSGTWFPSLRSYISTRGSLSPSASGSQDEKQADSEFTGPKNYSAVVTVGAKEASTDSDDVEDTGRAEGMIRARTDVSVVQYSRSDSS